MRRADRLFQIVQMLRRRRVALTARQVAERLAVSERTVYRDISDLVLAGTPIDGEAGVGYRLRPGYELPSLMFDREELQALVLGARLVRAFGDQRLARASDAMVAKIAAVVPKELEPVMQDTLLFVPPCSQSAQWAAALAASRDGLRDRRKLRVWYEDEKTSITERTVRPLGVFFWGKTWTLGAWCELRCDFRYFRLDRVRRVDVLSEGFAEEPGRTLRDLLAHCGARALDLLSD